MEKAEAVNIHGFCFLACIANRYLNCYYVFLFKLHFKRFGVVQMVDL
jgi:hypothetical protein